MSLIPLYRLQGHGDHFYTTSKEESDNAVSQFGYTYEGIACYVQDSPEVLPADTIAAQDLFWRQCYIAAMTNQVVLNSSSEAVVIEYASQFADKCLAEYQQWSVDYWGKK